MRIATYNVHRCVGRDGIKDPDRIISVLKEIDADVFALQEIAADPDIKKSVLNKFGEALQARIIEGFTLNAKTENYGNAILSLEKFSDVNRFDISVPEREPRGIIKISINHNSKKIDLFATHFGLSAAERAIQTSKLIAECSRSSADIKIAMGDFNEWFPWSNRLKKLKHTFGKTPAPATFPAQFPVLSLDRIWIQPLTILKSLKIHASETSRVASDHLPLVAQIEATIIS